MHTNMHVNRSMITKKEKKVQRKYKETHDNDNDICPHTCKTSKKRKVAQ